MTRTQRTMLIAYKGFRDKSPTMSNLIPQLARSWLLIAALCAVLLVLGVISGIWFVSGVGAGFFVGCLARDIGISLKLVHGWPITCEVIDWNRVDQLLSQNSN